MTVAFDPTSFTRRQVCDIPPDQIDEYEIVITREGVVNKKRYDAPQTNEVAGTMPGACCRGAKDWWGRGSVVHRKARRGGRLHGQCCAQGGVVALIIVIANSFYY